MKNVLITTKHRGVFAGQIEDGQDINAEIMPVKNAKMAIRFGTTKGVMELAETGPTSNSRISAKADIPSLRDITGVFDITVDAWSKWESA